MVELSNTESYEQIAKNVKKTYFLEWTSMRRSIPSNLRWLDTVFQGQYLPSLSINYVAIKKVLEKLPPQLYYIKMKICYDQGCNGIGVVIATK